MATTTAPAKKTATKKPAGKVISEAAEKPAAKKTTAPKTNGAIKHPQFEKFLEEVLTNPAAAAAFEDAQANAKLARDFVALRNELGMTQREVALKSGGHQPDITKVEKGTPLSITAMQRVARALGAKLVVTLERC